MKPARFFDRIDVRHAKIVILLALFLGGLTATGQIYLDYRAQTARLPVETGQLVAATATAAEQAVWELDDALAARIARGLFDYDPIMRVRIVTEFDRTLIDAVRPGTAQGSSGLGRALFGANAEISRRLFAAGAPDAPVGALIVDVDPGAVAAAFVDRALATLAAGLLQNLLFAGALLWVFHLSLTRPVGGVIDDLARIDPARPGDARLSLPPNHPRDELAYLVDRANAMLVAIDRSQEARRRAEDDRRSAERQLRAAADSIAEGVLLFDGDDRLVLFNPRFVADHPGMDGALAPGMTFDAVLEAMAARGGVAAGDAARAAWLESCRAVFAAPDASMEWPLLDGRWTRASRHAPEAGGAIVITSDITALKTTALELEARIAGRTEALAAANAALRREVDVRRSAERAADAARRDADRANADLQRSNAELDRANQAKSEFLARVSHELRTPLNAVIGYSEFILHQAAHGRDGAKTNVYVGHILESGRHLLALVNDVLDISRIEAAELVLHDAELDPQAVADAVAAMLEPDAQAKGVAFKTAFDADGLTLRADDRALRQIILNLLSNAIKFTPSGGRVTLSTAPAAGGGLRIAVADTGVGVAPADHQRIFEPFQQADDVATRAQPGTGLGLAITKSLVELHGGVIAIDSAVGEGCRIDVVFPPARVAAAAPPAASSG